MFVLAHLSDLHLCSRPRLGELAGKRALGLINWYRGRKNIHRPEVIEAIARDLKAVAVDHIAVTGDLVNLSLPDEYARARVFLDGLGPPSAVTAIPGNHDIYVPEALRYPADFWGDYIRGDDGTVGAFPFVRRRNDVGLIALSSALPTGPFMATGHVGAEQLALFAGALDQMRGLFRIVLIHHPPLGPRSRYLRRLTDAADFRRVLAEKGAELVLHGHDHRHSLVWLDGPSEPIPAVGVPSASALAPHGHENAAGYNLFHIDAGAGTWKCELVRRERGADGVLHEIERVNLR